MQRLKDIRLAEGETLRIIVPGGVVEISTGLENAEGNALVTVDTVSDTPRFGPDREGRTWFVMPSVVNGIVRMVGRVAGK